MGTPGLVRRHDRTATEKIRPERSEIRTAKMSSFALHTMRRVKTNIGYILIVKCFLQLKAYSVLVPCMHALRLTGAPQGECYTHF